MNRRTHTVFTTSLSGKPGRQKNRVLLLIAVALTLLVGCADPEEFARFEAAELNGLPDCVVQEFPLELDYFGARLRTESLGIFLQTTPDLKSRSDLVYFEIYRPEEVVVGEPLELGPPSLPAPPARGKLSFFSSCPYERQAFELRGELVFDAYSLEHHGVISGELQNGSAIDARTGQVVIEELTGHFHFVVRRGPPYEDFYALPERPAPGDP